MSPYLPVIVVALLVGAVWYFLGTTLARQRLTRWAYLVAGLLTPLGDEESFRWIGASGAEFRLTNVRRPFASLIAVIWVVPPWYAPARLLARARGQQTILGIAADLTVPPIVELVLANPATAVGRRALRRVPTAAWQRREIPFNGRTFTLLSPDLRAAERVVRAVERGRKRLPAELLRLVIQRDAPQLSISLGHPELLINARPPFARWLQDLATIANRG